MTFSDFMFSYFAHFTSPHFTSLELSIYYLVHVFVSTVQAPRLQDGQQIFEVDDDGGDVVAVRPLLQLPLDRRLARSKQRVVSSG